MLPRTLEPEVMDTADEAADYDAMDHREVNRCFAEEFLGAVERLLRVEPAGVDPTHSGAKSAPALSLTVLDVGTGTARIPIDICRRSNRVQVTGVDLSGHMLQLAQRNVISEGLHRQIRLEQVDAKGLPYGDGAFDAVISNSIVHHIPEPIAVVREMLRVVRPEGLLFVRDLLRPPDAGQIATILAKHAGGTNEHQRELFERSLHAALTLEEVGLLLAKVGLPAAAVYQSTDRHWTVCAVKAHS